ncbi:MAG TPA: alkaline phosphatase family protein, partial [Mycobacteriales bacterium]|nr:alkaline phosphatase family protein [Mycobacteriales bacterium]
PTIRSLRKRLRLTIAVAASFALAIGVAIGATAASASSTPKFAGYHTPALVSASYYRDTNRTATPIKHLVVIFEENESFDHYFGTYPFAANTDGTPFHAKPGTPTVNGLYTKITKNGSAGPLLTSNPNEYNPQRLTHAQALTCDQNHDYFPEQEAENGGKMNEFVQFTEQDDCSTTGEYYGPPGIVMDYFDGNTVTGLWNYAQNYAMSDNNWDTTFGPSTEGAIDVSSGLSSDGYAVTPSGTKTTDAGAITPDGTVYGDVDPYYDECSDSNHTSTNPEAVMTGDNIGDLLNSKHVTWGWFQGGFAPTSSNSGGVVCGAQSDNVDGSALNEYTPHWNPFQYNATTANPAHLPPSSEAAIGRTDQANHQYDLSDFYETLKDGNMPSVSYLKATTAQSAHPGESDPLDEQQFVVNTVNQIEQSRYWPSTAIVITYDDSDGWYDHVSPESAGALINGSDNSTIDTAMCEATAITVGSGNGRCGYSQRLPMIVISPYTRDNYVSSNLTDTASVVKFIENNWLHGERIPGSFDATSGSLDARGGLLDFSTRPHFQPVILNPTTGAVVSGGGWG